MESLQICVRYRFEIFTKRHIHKRSTRLSRVKQSTGEAPVNLWSLREELVERHLCEEAPVDLRETVITELIRETCT